MMKGMLALEESMRKDNMLSIIIPVYNTPESLLRRCIESVFRQTFENIEIIVVDDGSRQPERESYQEICCVDTRIRLLNSNHGGVSAARNMGLDHAQGEWIAFVDADDEVSSRFAEEAIFIADELDADFVCGECCRVFLDRIDIPQHSEIEIAVCFTKEQLKMLAKQMLGPYKFSSFVGPDFNIRGPVAKLYRASVLKDLRFNEKISLGEDALFNYRMVQECRTVVITNRVWYTYYQYAASGMHSAYLRQYVDSLDALLSEQRVSNEEEEFLTRCGFITLQGVENLMLAQGAKKARRESLMLLEFASAKGCFDSPAFDAYECPQFVKPMIALCRRRRLTAAYLYWLTKPLVKQVIFGKRLIPRMEVERSIR